MKDDNGDDENQYPVSTIGEVKLQNYENGENYKNDENDDENEQRRESSIGENVEKVKREHLQCCNFPFPLSLSSVVFLSSFPILMTSIWAFVLF